MIASGTASLSSVPASLAGSCYGLAAYPRTGDRAAAWPLVATVTYAGGSSELLVIRPGVFYQFDGQADSVDAVTADGQPLTVAVDRAKASTDFVNLASAATPTVAWGSEALNDAPFQLSVANWATDITVPGDARAGCIWYASYNANGGILAAFDVFDATGRQVTPTNFGGDLSSGTALAALSHGVLAVFGSAVAPRWRGNAVPGFHVFAEPPPAGGRVHLSFTTGSAIAQVPIGGLGIRSNWW